MKSSRGKIEADQSTISLRRMFMPLPDPIREVLAVFRPLFTAPTWRKLMTLLTGTLLAQGRRTVAAALRASGNAQSSNWSLFHQVRELCPLVSSGGEPPAPAAHRRDLCPSRSVRGSAER